VNKWAKDRAGCKPNTHTLSPQLFEMDGGDSNLSHNLNIPLIQDQTQRCHERNKNPQTDSSNGYATTSFLNTCFNGLNALSGTYYPKFHNLIQFFSALLAVSHTCRFGFL